MSNREDILKITEKYDKNYARFAKEASRKEFKTVLKWVADESNRKQRELVGLDSKDAPPTMEV